MASDALASLLLDRFVSASSAEDAHASLERILEALKSNKINHNVDENDVPRLAPNAIWDDPEVLAALRHVLRTGKHKHHDMEVPVDEGASLVCKIYIQMLEQAPSCPLLDKDESLVESLIDVISNSDSNQLDDGEDSGEIVSMYTRVLALQLLTKLCIKRPSKAQEQLLQAPNGLHRLGDLLQVHQEEIIRNEALLLAQVIAEWPSCAKIWMFSEVADQVMILAMEEGGLTGGNLLVQDCLDLLFKLWKHDPSLADLVFQSPTLTNNFPRLLDLRQGREFLNPSSKKATALKNDDDLDDILKSASDKDAAPAEDEVAIPRLTEGEEKIIARILDILALLLESDSLKKSVWSRQVGLCSLVWELGLFAPPPPQVPFGCAIPSPELQQKALETTSLYLNDPSRMESLSGLDRLLYLVCTGGMGKNLEEKMGISQAALHVIRTTISVESANQMLMHTLAPPMTVDEDENAKPQQLSPTVVHKLLNTVYENLSVTEGIDAEKRKVFLAGALGGLSIFLTDVTSREVMLRLTTTRNKAGEPVSDDDLDEDDPDIVTTSLIESILHAVGMMQEAQSSDDSFLSMTLLRFLCHWAIEAPPVVQTILSSNQSSMVLNTILGIKSKSQSHKKGVAVLGKLLLGLAMEYMGEDEGKCGGWTRTTIMDLIARKGGGVSKFTSSLEQFKSVKDFGDTMPWSACELEFKVWSRWFSGSVLVVRKRVVHELTGSGEGDDDEENEELPEGNEGLSSEEVGSSSARSLQKLVFQQSQEIDALRLSLEEANELVKAQKDELASYKRRVESAPSQLDAMLDESSSKISELERQLEKAEKDRLAAEEKHQTELQERGDKIQALQTALSEAKANEKESRDETESLREEIQSLSQAYTSLEQQFREQQQRQDNTGLDTATPVSEQQAGEQEEGPRQQQEQISNAGAGSTEISALRAENERLRNDATAADAWMAMAVEKMQAMGQQTAALQTELFSLKQGSGNSAVDQQFSELQLKYDALLRERDAISQTEKQLQEGLKNAQDESLQLQQAIQGEHEQTSALQEELQRAMEDLRVAAAALEESKRQAETNESNLNAKLRASAIELERMRSEIDGLEAKLLQERENLSSQGVRLDPQLASQYQTTIEQLQGELAAARSEVEEVKKQGQEEIYKGESRIRELEARLSGITSGQGGFEEDIKQRDNQISELEKANEAAQDWIRQAVDHHNMLSQQHAQLSNERDSLITQVRELKEKVANNEALVAQTRLAEERLKEKDDCVERLEIELKKLGSEAKDDEAKSIELDQLRSELESMQSSLVNQTTSNEKLKESLDAESGAKASLLAENEELQRTLDEVSNNNSARLGSLQQEVESLHASLIEKSSSLEEINRLLQAETESKLALQRQLDALSEKSSESFIQSEAKAPTVAQQTTTKSTSEVSAKDFFSAGPTPVTAGAPSASEFFSVASSGIGTANDFFAPSNPPLDPDTTGPDTRDIQKQLDDKARQCELLEEKLKQLSAEIEDLKGARDGKQLEELEATVGELQQKLQQKDEELKHQTSLPKTPTAVAVEGSDDLELTKAALADAVGKLEEAETVVLRWEEKVAELETTVQDLKVQLSEQEETASSVIAKWEESCLALEEKNAELLHLLEAPAAEASDHAQAKAQNSAEAESELEAAREALAEAEAKLLEDKDVVVKWEEEVARLENEVKDLEFQLKEQEENSKTVIERWEESCNALEEKNAQLLRSLEASGGSFDDMRREAYSVFEDQIQELQKDLDDSRSYHNADNDALLRWQERVAELERRAQDLERQLTEQAEEGDSAILKWQETVATLEEKNAELMSAQDAQEMSLASLQEQLLKANDSLAIANEEISELEAALAERKDQNEKLEAITKDLERQINDERQDAETTIARLEEEKKRLETTFQNLDKRNKEQGEETETIISKLEDEKKDLKRLRDEAETSLRATQAELVETREGIVAWKEKINEAEVDLAEGKNQLKQNEIALASWQERANKLESTIQDLEKALDEQGEEAKAAISSWEESYQALQEKHDDLVASLREASDKDETIASLTAQLEESKEKAGAAECAKVEHEERVASMESTIQELETQLKEQADEAQAAIKSWEESFSNLQESNSELATAVEKEGDNREKIAELQAKLEESKQALAKLQERTSEEAEKATQLKAEVIELKAKISSQNEECSVLKKENAALVDSLDQVVGKDELIAKLQGDLRDAEASILVERELVDKTVQEWQERAAKLEIEVQSLEAQLSEQEESANESIAQWEKSYEALQEKNVQLQESVQESLNDQQLLAEAREKLANLTQNEEELKERIAEMESSKQSLQDKLDKTEKEVSELQAKCADLAAQVQDLQEEVISTKSILSEVDGEQHVVVSAWQKRCDDLEMQINDMESQLNEQTQDAEEAISSWQESYSSMEKKASEMQEEKEVLEREMASLKEEIESLQIHSQDHQRSLEEANLKAERVTELEDGVKNLEDKILQLEQENTVLESSLQDALQRSQDNTNSYGSPPDSQPDTPEFVSSMRVQVEELEGMIDALQKQLLEKEKALTESRQESQRLAAAESKTDAVSQPLVEANEKIDALQQSEKRWKDDCEEIRALKDVSEEKVEVLESSLHDLRNALADERQRQTELERSAKVALEQVETLQTKVQQLENQIAEKDRELETSRERVASLKEESLLSLKRQAFDDSGSPEERISDLEALVESLENEIEESEKEAAHIVEQWQQSYTLLETTNGTLLEEVESLKNAKDELLSEMEQLRGMQGQAQDKIDLLNSTIESQNDETKSDLQSKIDEANAKILELESNLQRRDAQLAENASKNEELSKVRSDLDKVLTEKVSLEAVDAELAETKEQLSALQDKFSATDAELKETKELLAEAEDVVDQWADQNKQLENAVKDLQKQVDEKDAEALDAITTWESRCTELQEHINERESGLQSLKDELQAFLGGQLEHFDRLLASHEFQDDGSNSDETSDTNIQSLQAKLRLRTARVEQLLASQEADISTLFTELDNLRSTQQNQDDGGEANEMQPAAPDLEDLCRQIVEKDLALDELHKKFAVQEEKIAALETDLVDRQNFIDGLQKTISSEREVTSVLKARISESQEAHDADKAANQEIQTLLAREQVDAAALRNEILEKQTALDKMTTALSNERDLSKGMQDQLSELQKTLEMSSSELNSLLAKEKEIVRGLREEISALHASLSKKENSIDEVSKALVNEQESLLSLRSQYAQLEAELEDEKAIKSSLETKLAAMNEELSTVSAAEQELKIQLQQATSQVNDLRAALDASGESDRHQLKELQIEHAALKSAKEELDEEVVRLSKVASDLEGDLEEANNALQALNAFEVSYKATEMASQALRQQLDEIRKHADADRAAFLEETERRQSAEIQVEKLRADLLALVDISDQENELYGMEALTIKAAEKIHRKERSEMTELRQSLSRAMGELRTSRAAEKDAEERAAKAAHHVVVCEQELTAAKSDLKFLIQTMDEMRQDEASRRASLEHRIRTLENDHDVLRRFHASETDNLRNELTQVALDKDRAVQLLKDSEKNNAAMLLAASRDQHTGSNESPESELAKLRIEKAQLLIAAADEGARTERRLREVIATELSSAETDVLVERERRLAAEAASENMKLLITELQNDVQAYKEELHQGRIPTLQHLEQANDRMKIEIQQLAEDNSLLRSKLDAAENGLGEANYRIEMLEAECRVAQAASTRLDREIKFHHEVQAEMARMRPASKPEAHADSDPPKAKAEEVLPTEELYDQVQQQAAAVQKTQQMLHTLQEEHEELLIQLAQQEELKKSLRSALSRHAGQAAVDEAIKEAEENSVAQYGTFIRITESAEE